MTDILLLCVVTIPIVNQSAPPCNMNGLFRISGFNSSARADMAAGVGR